MNKPTLSVILTAAISTAVAVPLIAGDWPTWGRDGTRNMVSPEKNLPVEIEIKEADDAIDLKASKGVLWAA